MVLKMKVVDKTERKDKVLRLFIDQTPEGDVNIATYDECDIKLILFYLDTYCGKLRMMPMSDLEKKFLEGYGLKLRKHDDDGEWYVEID